MTSLLRNFGIVARLFDSADAFDALSGSSRPSSLEEIRQSMSMLIPKPCGVPLMRVGPARDGGYLLPDDLQGIAACFSPGTNNYKDFEDHLAQRHAIRSFMCDYSSDVSKLRTPLIEGLQWFEKKWLDIEASDIHLDINDWVAQNAPGDADLLLQMDIEGAEYRNLMHASSDTLSRFRVIVLEIHSLSFLARSDFREGVFGPVFDKLDRHFICVHAHPNNCCGQTDFGAGLVVPNVLEITLLRRDRVRASDALLELPHALDVVNVAAKPPLHLSGLLLQQADLERSAVNRLQHDMTWMQARLQHLEDAVADRDAKLDVLSFLCASTIGGLNVGRGGLATQSSLSSASTPEGAAGAVNGRKTGRFGFHTAVEDNPWWKVDLGALHMLDAIVLYNRLDAAQDRIRTLTISLSADGRSWTDVYAHRHAPPFGGIRPYKGQGPLCLRLDNRQARFVRLQCHEKTALHLDEVEIYGSRQARR